MANRSRAMNRAKTNGKISADVTDERRYQRLGLTSSKIFVCGHLRHLRTTYCEISRLLEEAPESAMFDTFHPRGAMRFAAPSLKW
jgi:hypothetical protein